MYIDLPNEMRTNGQFKHAVTELVKRIAVLEPKSQADPKASEELSSCMIKLYHMCNQNAGFLVPYFFPNYPFEKPLSLSDRPYSYAMFHMQMGGFTVTRASRQIGKALEENEPVLTPEGWVKIKNLKKGDTVYDGEGKPTKITGVFRQGLRDIYRMTFSDASYIDCDEEHVWVCKTAGAKHFGTKTLRQIRHLKGGDYPTSDQGIRIPLCAPVDLPKKDHYITPYLLGLLLGDGSLTPGNSKFTTIDIELLEEFKKYSDLEIKPIGNCGYNICTNLGERIGHKSQFRFEIDRMNLRHRAENKRIPDEYLYDSTENRLALLRGLMDTDGTIYGKCQIEFYSASQVLAEQVKFLVESLGGKAFIKIKKTSYKKDGVKRCCLDCFRVKILIQGINPFRLKRKADKFYDVKYDRTRVLKKIEFIGPKEAVCISVDSSDKTFITRNCIVTHNSTTYAARQLINAHMLPTFKSMYIVPHPSFLDTYANRIRDMERSFRFYQQHKDYRQNLKYKEYPNKAQINLIKCLTDTVEARSKTTDEELFDECVHVNTTVPTYEGGFIRLRKVSMLLDIDSVLTYDMQGRLKPAKIKNIQNKGKKHVYKFKFSNGSELICTGNTRFWTSNGWMFACEFLSWEDAAKSKTAYKAKTLLSVREAATPWDSSWRRVHAMGKKICGYIPDKSWRKAEGLLLEQVRGTTGLCEHTTKGIEEPRLGRRVVQIRNTNHSGVQFYSSPSIQEEHGRRLDQNCNQGVVTTTNVGGDSLVVSGRWDSDTGRRNSYQHAFLQPGGGSVTCGHVSEEGNSVQSTASKEGGEDLLHGEYRYGLYKEVRRKDRTVYTRVDEVQSGHQQSDFPDLRILPDFLSIFEGSDAKSPGLPGILLPTQSGEFEEHEIYREIRGGLLVPTEIGKKFKLFSGAESKAKNNTLGKEGRGEQVSPRLVRCEQGQDVRGAKEAKSESYSRATREGPRLREIQVSGSSSTCQKNGIAEAEEKCDDYGNLIPISLLSTEYVGMEEVWDIETETKTFFANGIAVHNCQLLDTELLPDIEQCQKASRFPCTIYAGTSTTVDSFLETNYQYSSKGIWVIPAPGYTSESVGKGWLNCGDENDILKAIHAEGFLNPATKQQLMVHQGHWLHQDRLKLEAGFTGFHIPQVIIPDYVYKPIKWREIVESYNKYRHNMKKFIQEILGIPTEEGQREITMKDLLRMCDSSLTADEMKARARKGYYSHIVSGCDWGGSDYNPASRVKVSYTVHVILGIAPDKKVDILHMRQYSGMDYRSIIHSIVTDHAEFRASAMGSDFGVGAAYNMLLRERQEISAERHMIFSYVGPNTAPIGVPKSGPGWFNQFSLNRTESISSLYSAIKTGDLRCYNWNESQDRLLELLNLYRIPTESSTGVQSFRYERHGAKADDTMHAINFAYVITQLIKGVPIVEDMALKLRINEMFNTNSHGADTLWGWPNSGHISG